ncbi:hypothetical protein BH10PSE19_BH10PSE19_10890 [soil metagenome]
MKKALLTTCAALSIGVLPVVNAKLIYKVDVSEPEARYAESMILSDGLKANNYVRVDDKKTTTTTPEDPQAPDEIQD